jgi:CheY-like chemotaxis protein
MSHEIRTPMNAITGMAELLMRTELSDEARSYALDIKQAGNNLISIINDILDISKIEAGRLELIPVKYMLTSLINDTVNIIRTRLKNKPIRFYTNIDGQIPNSLFGDELRIRQILLNLLSNATKFTSKGHISLTITLQKRKENKVWLDFSIADTGKGIKDDDQKKLFSEFVQVDINRNRNVEGTGLGLAITKRLALLMNGNINMKSEYGKGSVFNLSIPQNVDSFEPFAAVDNPKDKKVLVYERRLIYAESVCWSLENMSVPYTMVTNINDFSNALSKEEWTLVLSGYGLYGGIKQFTNKPDSYYPGGKKPQLALMIEWGTEAYIPDVRFVSLPIQSLSIANILNGKEDGKGYSDISTSGIIRHTFPSARILVVDDIPTNLKVSEGLLLPYRSKVDTCLSGSEAIELVKQNKYDLIFMDHMMIDMDGIETTAIIRDWETENYIQKRIPIVALTANAVFGVREMFIEKNFDDFLAKPIDLSALDDILNRWISKEKRENGVELNKPKKKRNLPNISGIDVQKGITLTGGTEEGYYLVLSILHDDALKRLRNLQESIKEKSLSAFTIDVHALKSALGSTGATDLSAEAARLETAGKEENWDFINENLDKFIDHLSKLVENINIALESVKAAGNNKVRTCDKQTTNNNAELSMLLQKLENELNLKKADNIDNIINEIKKLPLSEENKNAIEKIADNILMTEFDNAVNIIKDLLN